MKKNLLITLFAIGALMNAGCSSKKSSDSTSSEAAETLTLSGSLAAIETSGLSVRNSAMSVELSDLEIYGICFSTPPAIAQADVEATGAFSITLDCAPGNAVTAIFRTKADQAEVGTVVFTDTSKKDINGNDKESSSVVLGGDVDFGSITIDSTGKVKIPVSTIAEADTTVVDSGDAFDFTGVWKIKAYDGTMPTGYSPVNTGCDMNTGTGCDEPGPPEDFPLSIVRYAGKSFTKDAGNCTVSESTGAGTCAGTTGTDDVYAMQLWAGDATTTGMSAIKACGYKTGFTSAEAKAFAAIDLNGTYEIAGNAISLARITFSNPDGFGGDTCTSGDGTLGCSRSWMKTGSTAMWPVMKCTSVTKTGSDSKEYRLRACEVNNGSGVKYSAHLEGGGGGCFDSAGKPLRVDNWNNTGTCTQGNHPVTGLKVGSCTYVGQVPSTGAAATDYTCSHAGGLFDDSSLSTPTASNYQFDQGDYTSIVAQGGNCKDIPAANEIDRLQCYAQNYHGGGGGNGEFACTNEVRINWGATNVNDFEVSDDRGRPKGNFVTNIANYSPDGSTIFVNDDKEDSFSIPGKEGTSTVCKISRTMKISFKKISDIKLLGDLQESGRLLTADATCRAALAEVESDGQCKADLPTTGLCEELKGNKWLFYLEQE
ncbi:MAG: hypothetical protein AB7H97_15890 [Pseudobdellovibrionaceae bacterium]